MAVIDWLMLSMLALILSSVFSFVMVTWLYSMFFDPEEEEVWLD